MPAAHAAAKEGAGKIEHGGEIAVLPYEIRKFLRLFVKDFPHRKGMMGQEGLIPHLSQELPDASGVP